MSHAQRQPRSQTPSLFNLFRSGVESGRHPTISVTATTSFPDANLIRIPKRRGIRHHPRNSIRRQLQPQRYRERHWQRAYLRRLTPLETEENRQRQRHAHHWLATVYACTADIIFAPKCEPTNQIRVLMPTGARVAGRLLGVYKACPALPKSFGLGTVRVRLK